jgi:hypothetical protein
MSLLYQTSKIMTSKTHFSKQVKILLFVFCILCFYIDKAVAQSAVIIERNSPSITNEANLPPNHAANVAEENQEINQNQGQSFDKRKDFRRGRSGKWDNRQNFNKRGFQRGWNQRNWNRGFNRGWGWGIGWRGYGWGGGWRGYGWGWRGC